MQYTKQNISELEENIKQAQNELAQPFTQETELEIKKQRLVEITATINVNANAVNTMTYENDVISH